MSRLTTTQSQSPFEIRHSSENTWLQRFSLPQRMFPVVLGSLVLADCWEPRYLLRVAAVTDWCPAVVEGRCFGLTVENLAAAGNLAGGS